MIKIDFRNNNFVSEIEVYDSVDFDEVVNFFRSFYIFYNSNLNGWVIKDIDEFLLILNKYNYQYYFTEEGLQGLEELNKLYPVETKFFRGKEPDFSVLKDNVILYEYQKEFWTWAIKRNVVLNSLDCGLGKSLVTLGVFSQLYKEKKIDSIYLICPYSISFGWYDEILKFSKIFTEDDIHIIDNNNKKQPYKSLKDKKIIIVPTHIFHETLLSYRKDYKPKMKNMKRLKLKNFNLFNLWGKQNIGCIVDEGHYFKHSDTIRYIFLNQLKQYFKYRHILTATPAINRFEDFYTQITFLDKSLIPLSEKAFKRSIATSIGNKFSPYTINSYNEFELEKYLKQFNTIFYKKNKSDIPEMKYNQIEKIIKLQMSKKHYELYKIVSQLEVTLIEEDYDYISISLLNKKLRMTQTIVDNPVILKYIDNSYIPNDIKIKIDHLLSTWKDTDDFKFQTLKEKLENYIDYQNEKVVVFCQHPENLDFLYEKFKKYNPILIHGQVKDNNTNKDRYDKINTFNNDPKCKLALLSFLTSSVGHNLQKACRRNIYYSIPNDTTQARQAKDRTHRITSTQDTILEYLYYYQTIDKFRIDRMFNRIELNDKLDKNLSREDLKKLLTGM